MKKPKINSRLIQLGVILLLVAIVAITFCYLIYHKEEISTFWARIGKILAPLFDGLVIAFLLIPMINFFEHKFFPMFIPKNVKYKLAIKRVEAFENLATSTDKEKEKYYRKTRIRMRLTRTASIVLSLLIIAILIYGFLYSVIPQIRDSITSIISKSDSYSSNMNKLVEDFSEKHPDLAGVIEKNWNLYYDDIIAWRDNTLIPLIKNWLIDASKHVVSFFSAAWNLIIGLIISIYILASKEKFSAQAKKVFYSLLGAKAANDFIDNLRFANKKFSGFIVGKLVDSFIIGIICFLCCLLFKFDYPVLIALIIGVTNIIPFFGPIFGAVPCAILLFMINPMKALYFLLFIIALQQFDGNILGPKILGDSTGVSGFWVIISITFFGGLWGVPGMILGVPIFAVLYAIAKHFVERRLRIRKLPSDTNRYYNLERINEETGALIKHPPGYQVRRDDTKNTEMKFRNPFRKKDPSTEEEPNNEIISSDYKVKEQRDKKHSDQNE
ncbi:MAG: AI-2E family transporter [Lachnospiraceae bacterium]|nr:AI-2E family transporter [Lachnospiraceae bacterium]